MSRTPERPTVVLNPWGTVAIASEKDIPSLHRRNELVLCPLAAEAIRILNDLNARVVFLVRPEEVAIVERLRLLLDQLAGAEIEMVHETSESGLDGIVADRGAPLFVISGSAGDLAAGRSIGMRTILIRTGDEEAELRVLHDGGYRPDFIADDLYTAANMIGEMIED
jgi:hypothetical protein